jgi:hypothetical protein
MNAQEIIEELKPMLCGMLTNAYRDGYLQGMDEMRKELSPDKDLISMREAVKIYGRPWLQRNIDCHRIDVHRSGTGTNAKMWLSKAQMRLVWQNERNYEIIKKY